MGGANKVDHGHYNGYTSLYSCPPPTLPFKPQNAQMHSLYPEPSFATWTPTGRAASNTRSRQQAASLRTPKSSQIKASSNHSSSLPYKLAQVESSQQYQNQFIYNSFKHEMTLNHFSNGGQTVVPSQPKAGFYHYNMTSGSQPYPNSSDARMQHPSSHFSALQLSTSPYTASPYLTAPLSTSPFVSTSLLSISPNYNPQHHQSKIPGSFTVIDQFSHITEATNTNSLRPSINSSSDMIMQHPSSHFSGSQLSTSPHAASPYLTAPLSNSQLSTSLLSTSPNYDTQYNPCKIPGTFTVTDQFSHTTEATNTNSLHPSIHFSSYFQNGKMRNPIIEPSSPTSPTPSAANKTQKFHDPGHLKLHEENFKINNDSRFSQARETKDQYKETIRQKANVFMETFCPSLGDKPYCYPPIKRGSQLDKSNKQLVQVLEGEKRVLGSFEGYFSERQLPVFMLCHYPLSGFMHVFHKTQLLKDRNPKRDTITLLLSHEFPVTIVSISAVSGNSDFAYIQKGVLNAAQRLHKCSRSVEKWLTYLGLDTEIREVIAFPNLRRTLLKRMKADKQFQHTFGSICTLQVDDLSSPFEEEWSTLELKKNFTNWINRNHLCSSLGESLSKAELKLFIGALLSPDLSKFDYISEATQSLALMSQSAPSPLESDTTDGEISQMQLTIDGIIKSFDAFMEEFVRCYYPNVDNQIYRVPPIHFYHQTLKKAVDYSKDFENEGSRDENKFNRSIKRDNSDNIYMKPVNSAKFSQKESSHLASVAALKDVDVLLQAMAKDVRADEGENRVATSFEMLLEPLEIMFIITGYQYNNYLNKLREDMFAKGEIRRPIRAFGQAIRAEHDCLIFHKKYGAIVVCIKAIGDNFEDWHASADQKKSAIKKILQKALKQLDREVKMIKHVTTDLHPNLACHKLIALPNMSRECVQEVLSADPALLQEIQEALGNGPEMFLCAEELPPKNQAFWSFDNKNYKTIFQNWWKEVTGRFTAKDSGEISPQIYRQLIGRYVGLLSTVEVWSPTTPRIEVRTPSQSVSECAQRFHKFVLLPDQVKVLCSNNRRTFLYGPPGSGKTLILILKALEWLQAGETVTLVNSRPGSRTGFPYAYGVYQKLKQMMEKRLINSQKLLIRNIDPLTFVADEVADVLPSACIIMDEVTEASHLVIEHLCCLQVKYIWCAGIFPEQKPVTAHGFTAHRLVTILRCPPFIQSVLRVTESEVRLNHPYKNNYRSSILDSEYSVYEVVRSKFDQPSEKERSNQLVQHAAKGDQKTSYPKNKEKPKLQKKSLPENLDGVIHNKFKTNPYLLQNLVNEGKDIVTKLETSTYKNVDDGPTSVGETEYSFRAQNEKLSHNHTKKSENTNEKETEECSNKIMGKNDNGSTFLFEEKPSPEAVNRERQLPKYPNNSMSINNSTIRNEDGSSIVLGNITVSPGPLVNKNEQEFSVINRNINCKSDKCFTATVGCDENSMFPGEVTSSADALNERLLKNYPISFNRKSSFPVYIRYYKFVHSITLWKHLIKNNFSSDQTETRSNQTTDRADISTTVPREDAISSDDLSCKLSQKYPIKDENKLEKSFDKTETNNKDYDQLPEKETPSEALNRRLSMQHSPKHVTNKDVNETFPLKDLVKKGRMLPCFAFNSLLRSQQYLDNMHMKKNKKESAARSNGSADPLNDRLKEKSKICQQNLNANKQTYKVSEMCLERMGSCFAFNNFLRSQQYSVNMYIRKIRKEFAIKSSNISDSLNDRLKKYENGLKQDETVSFFKSRLQSYESLTLLLSVSVSDNLTKYLVDCIKRSPQDHPAQIESQEDTGENDENGKNTSALNNRLKELSKASLYKLKETIFDYFPPVSSKHEISLPSDGPRPHLIDHSHHSSPGLPAECRECGNKLAEFLTGMVSHHNDRNKPHMKEAYYHKVNASGQNVSTLDRHDFQARPTSPSISLKSKWSDRGNLTWSDVIIVTRELQRDSQFVHALRSKHIPVEVVMNRPAAVIEEKKSNTLYITSYKEVTGIERAIIVFVPSEVSHHYRQEKQPGEKTKVPDLQLASALSRFTEEDKMALWYVASRCLASLVLLLP